MANNKKNNNVWAIVLAAGKGTRMNATSMNKVAYPLHGKPIISRTIENLENANIHQIITVVGFAKESVISLLPKYVQYAVQDEQLGTGHAVKIGLEKIGGRAQFVIVVNGDDSYLLKKHIIDTLIDNHIKKNTAITFLTTTLSNPSGLGRVIRNSDGEFIKLVEEKDATENERKVTEINPACYVFDYTFLKKEIVNIKKSLVTGEYYINSLFDIATEKKMPVEPVLIEGLDWRGINTKEELDIAEKIVKKHE